jgi:hypothetical protein
MTKDKSVVQNAESALEKLIMMPKLSTQDVLIAQTRCLTALRNSHTAYIELKTCLIRTSSQAYFPDSGIIQLQD